MTTPIPFDISRISNTKDLVRLVEDVKKTGTPRVLTKDDETLAVLVPAGVEKDAFAALAENKAFIKEADEAKQQLAATPSQFPNLTQKYAHLIKAH